MNLDDLTLGQIREIQNVKYFRREIHPYEIGKMYAIRTVTMIQVGRVMEVHEQELVLTEAAWVADTGRFYGFLKTGQASEVEPMPGRVIVGRGAIVDCCEWNHEPLTEQK